MIRILTGAAVLAAFTVPALAQGTMAQDLTCGDLMAMDQSDQMEAMTQMEMAMAESQGTSMTEDQAMASGEEMMPGTMSACEGNPDMMAMEAMEAGMNQ